MARRPLCYPDFILIGPPNAGMEVIKTLLARDPHIWFPPIDNVLAFHHGFAVARYENFQKFIKGELRYNPKNLSWLLRYFLKLTPSPEWYGKLFWTRDDTLFKGEFSDEYINLPHDQVSKLYETIPECKIVMILRDPVERSYAAVRERFEKNPKLPFSKMTRRQILAVMNSDWARSHSTYQSALDNWVSFFPPQQIYYTFYEDLLKDPGAVYEEIRAFLGLEPAPAENPKALLPKPKPPFPDALLKHLHPFYRLETKGLAARIEGEAVKWFARHPPPPPPAPEPEPQREADGDTEPGTPADETAATPEAAAPDAPQTPESPLIKWLVAFKIIKPRTKANPGS